MKIKKEMSWGLSGGRWWGLKYRIEFPESLTGLADSPTVKPLSCHFLNGPFHPVPLYGKPYYHGFDLTTVHLYAIK
jgi:hypothetical protein